MRQVIVTWGKFRLEMPAELLLMLLFWFFLALHSVNG